MNTHAHVAVELESSALDALLQAERLVSERLAAADRIVADLNAAAIEDVQGVEREAAIALTARLAQLTHDVHTSAIAEAERQLDLATRQAAALDTLGDEKIRVLADTMLVEFLAPLHASAESGV